MAKFNGTKFNSKVILIFVEIENFQEVYLRENLSILENRVY